MVKHQHAAIVGNSADAMKAIFSQFPNVKTVLDSTYGLGRFWKQLPEIQVCGGDKDVLKAKNVVLSLDALPFKNDSFDAVVLDPPFMFGGEDAAMQNRFGHAQRKVEVLFDLYARGVTEGLRVAKQVVIAKCADCIEDHKFVPVAARVVEKTPPLWDILITIRQSTINDPRWVNIEHLRHNYAYYLIWKK